MAYIRLDGKTYIEDLTGGRPTATPYFGTVPTGEQITDKGSASAYNSLGTVKPNVYGTGGTRKQIEFTGGGGWSVGYQDPNGNIYNQPAGGDMMFDPAFITAATAKGQWQSRGYDPSYGADLANTTTPRTGSPTPKDQYIQNVSSPAGGLAMPPGYSASSAGVGANWQGSQAGTPAGLQYADIVASQTANPPQYGQQGQLITGPTAVPNSPQGVPKDQYISGLVGSGQTGNITPPQAPQASQTGGNAADPYSKARTEFEAYLATLMPSADETSAQTALTNAQQGLRNIESSTALGLAGVRNRPVATPVIGGYERNIQQTAAAKAGVEQGNVNIAQTDLTRYLAERTNKSNVAKARLDFEAGIAGKMADQNKPFQLGAGESQYVYNPSTGKYEVAASVPATVKTDNPTGITGEYQDALRLGLIPKSMSLSDFARERSPKTTNITYNQQQDQAQQAAIAKAQTTLAASRGKDGYVDPDVYLQQLTDYVSKGGNASNFEATFLGQVNPNDRARISGKVPADTGGNLF